MSLSLCPSISHHLRSVTGAMCESNLCNILICLILESVCIITVCSIHLLSRILMMGCIINGRINALLGIISDAMAMHSLLLYPIHLSKMLRNPKLLHRLPHKSNWIICVLLHIGSSCHKNYVSQRGYNGMEYSKLI